MQIDHVIVGTHDLAAAERRLAAAHGLVAASGGRHDGLGTENRIVPLGRGYLELLGVADEQEAASSTFGRWLLATLAHGEDRLMGWAVTVEDAQREAARVRAQVERLSRPGLVVHHAGMREAAAAPCLPFFLAREGAGDPGRQPADHARAPEGIARIELSGDEEGLRTWLGHDGAQLPLHVQPGPPALRTVAIAMADGSEIAIR